MGSYHYSFKSVLIIDGRSSPKYERFLQLKSSVISLTEGTGAEDVLADGIMKKAKFICVLFLSLNKILSHPKDARKKYYNVHYNIFLYLIPLKDYNFYIMFIIKIR